MLFICDEVDITLAFWIGDLQDFDIQSEQKFHIRNQCDSKAICHQSGNNLIFVRLVDDIRFLSNLFKQRICKIPQSCTLIKIDIRIIQCFLQWNPILVRKRMSVRYDQDQILLHDRSVVKIRTFRWRRGKYNIIISLFQIFQKNVGGSCMKGKVSILFRILF